MARAQIRNEAMRRGVTDNAGHVPFFEELMLRSVRRHGRLNDTMAVARYKLRAGGLLKDWRLGLKMWRAGKMKLRHPRVADPDSIARLFDETPPPAEDGR